MPESERCREVRELIPELAMGVASGEARARGLAHLATCASCRRELEDVSGTVDALLLLAPEREPPAGFDVRVLAALDQRPPRHRIRTGLLVAAAMVLVATLAGGLTWWRGAEDRDVADDYRGVLSTADGSYLRAADLTIDGASAGSVFAYQGRPSWLFMSVEDAPNGTYHVRLVGTDGRTRWLGTCTVKEGTGAWGTTVDVPIRSVDRVEMFGDSLPTVVANLRR
ncbi:zf-HC2 domain-containing protein [Nocardioides sp. NPDC057577]|uniref:zf-HC2 domain-containing protein n=1 Tax=Nocardioides sp. NPDC057577 TaxID=3346171 RepID=UPI00366D902D